MFVLLLFLFSALLQLFMPWWVVGMLCFCMALGWDKNLVESFWKCGLSQFLLWLGYAALQDSGNGGILSARIAVMFGLPTSWLLPLLSGLLIGLLSGFAGLSGALVRDAFIPSSKT